MKKRLKILFVTQDDPFYIKNFFEEFLSNYSDKFNVLGVVICPAMAKKSILDLLKQMYEFYGFKDFFCTLLRYFLLKLRRETLTNICKKHNIAVTFEKDINSRAFIDRLRNRGLDVIVSVAAPLKFKAELLQLPILGCVNVHHAKLPYYRGMMPNFWQMYRDEKFAGLTVHKMNLKIDEGEIILQKDIPIEKGESLDTLIKRTKKIAAHCIAESLDLMSNNKAACLPNIPGQGSYFSFPKKENVIEFRHKGKKIYG